MLYPKNHEISILVGAMVKCRVTSSRSASYVWIEMRYLVMDSGNSYEDWICMSCWLPSTLIGTSCRAAAGAN